MKARILECEDWPELVGKIGEVWEQYEPGGEFDLRLHIPEEMSDNESWSFRNEEVEFIE